MIHLLKYAKNYRKQLVLGPFFKFLEALFELFLPLLMAHLVDEGIQSADWAFVKKMTVAMVVTSIVGLSFASVCQYYASIASQGFGTELRNQLMKKINTLSHQELNLLGTDTLITRMTNDINQMQLALAMLIRLVVRAPFLSIGAVVMSFAIDWQMGLIFLIVLPVFCLILFAIVKLSVPLYKKVQSLLDRINEIVSQNLSGVRVIRAFSRRTTEIQRFNRSTDDLSVVYIRVSNISALLNPMTTFILNMGILAILLTGGVKVNIGHLQQGQILALVNYMNQMLLSLITISNLVVIFTRASASAVRVNQVLASKVSVSEDKQPQEPGLKNGRLSFARVDFRFSSDFGLALKNINFAIETGQTIGITGPTGSGKTALTQLIPRFYDVSQGSVKVDGLNVKKWPLHELRKAIGMVPQTAVLFSGTLRKNLQWGKADASDEECWQALKIAQADEFVAHLPKGLDTTINEGGKNLSGGQRQRLTIARALIKQPEILILDDSLSALDYQTDYDLRQALKKLPCTVLIISQRIRSIQDADQIFVMDSGELLAKGKHPDLLKNSTTYQQIFASQEEGIQ